MSRRQGAPALLLGALCTFVCGVQSGGCASEASAVCGDGVVEGAEVCDDGLSNTHQWTLQPRCNALCSGLGRYCGDGKVDSQEYCDAGAENSDDWAPSPHCNSLCDGSAPYCGDGRVDGPEVCDDGAENRDGWGVSAICDDTCKAIAPFCGDGVIQSEETCDQGPLNSASWAFDPVCGSGCAVLAPHCGDGVVNGPEFCDDGAMNSDLWAESPHCDSVCGALAPHCGDGIQEEYETCDDGFPCRTGGVRVESCGVPGERGVATCLDGVWNLDVTTCYDPRLVAPPLLYGWSQEQLRLYPQNIFYNATGRELSVLGAVVGGTVPTDPLRLPLANSQMYSVALTVSWHPLLNSTIDSLTAAGGQCDSPQTVLVLGDSIVAGGQIMDSLAMFVPLASFVGTQSTTTGVMHEAYSGKTWNWFVQDVQSPLTDASGTMAVEAYVAGLALEPDYVFILLGTNDVFLLDPLTTDIDSEIETRIFGSANILFQALEAALAGVRIGIGLIPPGNERQSAFDSNYPTPPFTVWQRNRWRWRDVQHRANELWVQKNEVGVLPDSVDILATHAAIDPLQGYPIGNALHPNAQGSLEIAAQIAGWLEHHCGANN